MNLEKKEASYCDINKIMEKLENINTKLDILLEKQNNEILEKMSNHIDFIDSIYDNVKQPFHYVMNMVSRKIENSDDVKTIEK